MFTIRGATTINEDMKDEILNSVEELLSKIIEANNIDKEKIISIIFSATKDIKSVYPAEGARKMGITNASLMCLQEMEVENSLERCIRVMLLVNGDKNQTEVKNIYLRDSIILRPDILEGK
ncbi:Chorismate mutase AroH [Caloramator mitchellensis]|uniref:chorismate mutase n=1 Tax=Caloramator mitchellensis TaxID=908809 RepID=A0A0R3JSY7_CALMK|nr:chorismate mutase [Caloramator mitchellensis]KRQ86625.1 Chorismate mutase AroH [Caloramator mitchellensis]